MSVFESNFGFGVAILFLVMIITQVSGDYDGSVENDSGLCLGPDCADRPSNGVSGAMWFGPRLGRRRRSGPVSHVNDDDINTIADAINSGPWALVSYQGTGDKRHSTQFTPRLGRELEDNLLQRYLALGKDNELYHLMDTQINPEHRQLSLPPPPLFAPRLGRQLPFMNSPRLRHLLQNSRNF
ncbi:PBAN-type neuropeptides-like [Microplitis demolitor]|uniref:PBAN-type neuropeptides-like n=1 Tax=Microplitis demolitor TaxID=69319 RepID=UPI0004CD7E46|nr:PBAN-type neuropeptides-like [Microplitis demolitor]